MDIVVFEPFEFLPDARSPVAFCDDPRFFEVLEEIRHDPVCSKLMEHQFESTAFLSSRDCAILADDMGSGKTHASAAVAIVRRRLFPCFVICQPGMRHV